MKLYQTPSKESTQERERKKKGGKDESPGKQTTQKRQATCRKGSL